MSEHTMTTDDQDDIREQAYIILQVCADHYVRGLLSFHPGASGTREACEQLDFLDAARELALLSFIEAGRRWSFGRSWPDSIGSWTEIYAYASSLIASGWEP